MTESTSIQPARNPYLTSLREQVVALEPGTGPRWLVLTCDEPFLSDERLRALLPGGTLILRTPGAEPDHFGFPAAVRWALLEASVDRLVVCSHTQCGHLELDAPELPALDTVERGYARLVVGAKRTYNARERARLHLQRLVRRLGEDEMVRRRCVAGELALYGLLYATETETFHLAAADSREPGIDG